MTIEEKVQHIFQVAKQKGIVVHKPDMAVDLSEPLMGVEAREALDDVAGHDGTFRTVHSINAYGLLELTGYGEDPDADEIADTLDSEAKLVFEAFEALHDVEYGSTIMFFFKE